MLAKKRFVVLIALVVIVLFSSSAFAGSGTYTLTSSDSCELVSSYRPSGSYNGKIAVTSLSGSSPSVYMVMYGEGFVVVDRTFTSTGSSTRHYSLAGLTRMGVSLEKKSSSNLTVGAEWDFNY